MFWLLVVVALAALVFIIYLNHKKNEDYWKHIMAIPGPKAYPIIGSEYKLQTSESMFPRDRKLAKQYFPIFKIVLFNMPIVMLLHPEDMELVLSNSKHIEKSAMYDFLQDWLGFGLLTSKGQNWHKRRKLITPAFHFNILQEFVEVFNKETAHLVEAFRKECHKSYIAVFEPISDFTLNAIGETSLGIDFSNDPKCPEYKKAVFDFGEYFVYRLFRPWLRINFLYGLSHIKQENKKTVETLHDFSENAIASRYKIIEQNAKVGNSSERKRLALLDLMIKYKNNGADIDDLGIREEVDTFILGGHDTTAASLAHTLMLLANEQEIQEEVYQELISVVENPNNPAYADLGELKYMERCIKESLRLFPSAPSISRITGEDIKTKTGYTIPKGCNVGICIYDMHRSPAIWENPEKFDPDRFLPENITRRHPYSYLPFSAGSRNCIGQKYAMLEMKSCLCGIMNNFKLEPVSRPSDMNYKSGIVLRPINEIKVKFIPRN